ncbi:hypothetical protein [Prevotella sp. CAG:592]|uniref:hypothetical protein n=1 Tax=Prevotella sp. CAG:592 TaxID=1262931 RepID=UPI00033DF285|nr:hypothetical protein [Prevotella sp. CAG:592]CDD03615.1 putative uncharacterized protein [Prevotella sp. CAG:592]
MRLKHFPTGLLRCGISKRKAKLFVTALMVAATAQTCFAQTTGTETSGSKGKQPIAAWTGTKPSEANGKTVYLYNIGTKQFLGKGGRWGTEATMNVEGAPFELTYTNGTFTLTSKVKQEGGDSNGKLTLMDGTDLTSKFDKFNYFVDGNVRASENHTITATGTPTEGYTLSITSTSSKPDEGNKSSMAGKTFYMFAEGANAHVSARLETTSTMRGIPADSTAYSKWIIVTEDQRKDAFKTVNNAHVAAVNATFLMSDFDFARNDNSCEEWKTGATSTENPTGTLSYKGNKVCKPTDAIPTTIKVYTYTSEHAYKYDRGTQRHTSTITTTVDHGETWERECQESSKHDRYHTAQVTYKKTNTEQKVVAGYTYYLGNGYDEGNYTTDPITGETMTVGENRQQSYGGAWTANIHGARGSVVQTIPTKNMIKEGWYRVSCVGFTTATKGIARLYAAAGMGNTTGSATAQSEKFAIANLHRIDPANKPATYVAASKLLDTPNVNTFDASVKVYVSPTNEAKTTFETLSFGIQVGSAADDTQDADDNAWTCFDNFKIEYLGTPPNELILDEDQTDGGYIKAQAQDDDKTLQKSIVYLHRTMNTDKWNSLVLPISLNVGQVKSIFGDQVHISEFKGAYDENHPQRIIFDPITANRNDPDAIAIEEGKLYLVKPTADGGMPQKQAVKTFNKDGYNISVEDYYTIVGVTFKKKSEIADNAYSGRVMGDKGSEEYGTAQQVQFVGTYVQCFDNDLIPANSYVLNGNNKGGTAGLWYYRKVKTKTKGFRGWLQSVQGQVSNVFEYEIEGVVEQVNGNTTAIDGIEAAQQHSANIYNLNGQLVRQGATSTEGLPSGLYIVGGKKLVVK